jgi:predicted metal-dependent phosphoesterase TrpH
MIDLHTHTTASDGRLTPEELITRAEDVGLCAVAITDHDTVDGIAPARRYAQEIGMPFVPGIEISAEYTATGTMHILGYFIDETTVSFSEALAFLKRARKKRNPLIIRRLNHYGVDITMEDVRQEAGSGQIGRPHFARAIVRKGYASSITEAFERYIKKGGPCYVNKERFSPQRAIELIRAAGGIPVIAHPKTLNIDFSRELPRFLGRLKEMGLMGLEAYYYSHSKSEEEYFLGLSRKFSILATGGSDFHGDNKPKVALGKGSGKLHVPRRAYDLLIEAKEKIDAHVVL